MASIRLTITTDEDGVFELEVNDELEVETLAALCEIETGIPSSAFRLVHDGRFVQNPKDTLADAGIGNGAFLFLYRVVEETNEAVRNDVDSAADDAEGAEAAPDVTRHAAAGATSREPPESSSSSDLTSSAAAWAALTPDERRRLVTEAASLREALLSRPEEVAVLKERNPGLGNALVTGDAAAFAAALHELRTQQLRTQELAQQQRSDLQQQRPEGEQQRRNLLDPRVQEMIAAEIRRKNVEANRAAAMEFNPEHFAKVSMLFLPVRVNGHPVKAFVDTGSQTTLINLPCARRCNLLHLMDRSYTGVAYGVGTQRIVGRVHVAPLQIGTDFLESSFNVVENEPLEMLLGLDVLSRHECLLDLRSRELVLGSSGRRVAFLRPEELPDLSGVAREEKVKELEDEEDENPEELDDALAEALRRMGHDATAPSATAAAATTTAAATSEVDASDVDALVKMGFERETAAAELASQGGDVDQTVAALLAKSLTFGPS